MSKVKLSINWNMTSKKWDTLPFSVKIYGKKTILKTLEYLNLEKKTHSIETSVLLANDKTLQELNNNFRGKNKPTNVLSFPSNIGLDAKKSIYLGDIAISYNTLYNESLEQGKSFKDHFTHMLIHSILHLLGYDHIKEKEAKAMEQLEIKILSLLKIKNPYE